MTPNEQTTRDAANEVVRAAVEWYRQLDRLDAATDDDSTATYHDVSVVRAAVYGAKVELLASIETYLAANNLPDSAQHPTPNPG